MTRDSLEAFAFQALALKLTCAPDGLGLLARPLFRRFFEIAAQLHFPENAFALHLLLQRLQRLIDIVVANENLNQGNASFLSAMGAFPPMGLSTHNAYRAARRFDHDPTPST